MPTSRTGWMPGSIRSALAALPLLLVLLTAPLQAAVVSGSQGGDQELAALVYARIGEAWGRPTGSLTVAVQDGLVELTGEAPTQKAVREATRVAEGTPGVVTVLNRLQVRADP